MPKTKTNEPTSRHYKNNQTTGDLDCPVQVNFTREHKLRVQKAANAAGLTLAAFIRQATIKALAVPE